MEAKIIKVYKYNNKKDIFEGDKPISEELWRAWRRMVDFAATGDIESVNITTNWIGKSLQGIAFQVVDEKGIPRSWHAGGYNWPTKLDAEVKNAEVENWSIEDNPRLIPLAKRLAALYGKLEDAKHTITDAIESVY